MTHTSLIVTLCSLLLLLHAVGQPPQPEVGFLRVYNCMSGKNTFIPHLANKPLTNSPVKSGSKVSGLYLKAGTYDLSLESADFTLKPVTLQIAKNETTTLVALHKYNEKTETLEPHLITLSSVFHKTHSPQTVPLIVRSFSRTDLILKTTFGIISLPALTSVSYKRWKGTPFQLKITTQQLGSFRPEDTIPHTLIIWDLKEGVKKAVLIPNTTYSAPPGLRGDLSFGKKRSEFKNLKTLKAREPVKQ